MFRISLVEVAEVWRDLQKKLGVIPDAIGQV